jgi:hypothetical protein
MSDPSTAGSDDLGRLLQAHFRSVADDFPAPGQLAAAVTRTRAVRSRPAWLASLFSGAPPAPIMGRTGGRGPVDESAVSWLGARAFGSRQAQRRVSIAALLGLLVVALLGAAVAGGLLLDPQRADVPPAVPSATAGPLLSRSDIDELFAESKRFTSRRFGYSIVHPEGWQEIPATTTWDGFGPRAVSDADQFMRSGESGVRLGLSIRPRFCRSSSGRIAFRICCRPRIRAGGADLRLRAVGPVSRCHVDLR